MASQVLHWTLKIVRKLKPNRKSRHKKITPVREASISRPSLRRPSGPYSQRRTEVEPLPYPWAEIDHGRQSAQSGTSSTHHYPHIYYQDGQYHTVRWPPLSSSPTPSSRANSPTLSAKSGHSKAIQRSFTYPAGLPHNGRSEVWWAGANQPRVLMHQSQHPWNRTSSPHPGGVKNYSTYTDPFSISPKPMQSLSPPVPPKQSTSGPYNPSHRNATPGPSCIPLRRNATPGPSRLPDLEPLLPAIQEQAQNAIIPDKSRRKKKPHKMPDKQKNKSKSKSKGKRPAEPQNPLDFPHGVTPPAVQQHLRNIEEEERRKAEEYKPTAQFSAHDGFWLRRYEVDPRDPPPDFPYEKYLEMRKAEHERERRLRNRELEREDKRLALDLQSSASKSPSRWPFKWIRRLFCSKSSSSSPVTGRRQS